MAEELQSWVNYYARAGFGHHIYTLCCRQLQKRPHHPILLFWQAFGAVLEGLYIEGLQILEGLQENKELRLGVLALKLHVQHCHGAMEEKVEDLHQQLSAAKEVSSEKAMLHAATVYWNLPGMHNLQKAKELIQRIWTIEPQSPLVKCIRGWIILKEINCQNSRATEFGSAENALECFVDMINESTHIDGFLGKSYYYEIAMDYAQALSELNQAIVNYPKFLPALCEKGRVGLLMQDWDVVQETSQYILTKDSENIDGLRLRIHWLLCHENNVATAASLVADLLKSIDLNEPHNANLYYEVSKSIAAIVGRRQNEILHKTINLVQRAQAILPEEVSYVVELANQLFLLADYTSAIAKYRLASQMDNANMDPIYGLAQCFLSMDMIKEGEEQVQLLSEVSPSRSARLSYLMAQLEWKMNKSHGHCAALLAEAIISHKKEIRSKYNHAFYSDFRADMLLGIAELYFALFGLENKGPLMEQSVSLLNSASTLEMILTAIPGFLIGQLMLAHVYFYLADIDSAFHAIQLIFRLDSSCARAHLLLAQ